MDKSSITWTRGSDWWLSRTTMSGRERYPKQIRVGDLDRSRVYYPVDRDALLALADDMEGLALTCDHYDRRVAPIEVARYAARIRKALGVEK